MVRNRLIHHFTGDVGYNLIIMVTYFLRLEIVVIETKIPKTLHLMVGKFTESMKMDQYQLIILL